MKIMEKEINDCSESYHSLFERTSDSISITDFKGNFKDVNSSLCALVGYTKEELLQLNVCALLDQEQLAENPIRFDLLSKGENVFNERKMVHRNGDAIYVEVNGKK